MWRVVVDLVADELRRADWDVDGVRDDVRAYVIENLGDKDGVLIADETGFITNMPGPGHGGAGDASTRPGSAITGDEVTYLPEPAELLGRMRPPWRP